MEEFAGPWLDRRTGKTVMVRDAVMDGDDLVIISSLGQIPNEIFSNYFIRMSDEEYSASNITPEVSGTQLNAMINNGLDKDLQISQTVATQEITLDTPIGGPTVKSNIKSKPDTQKTTTPSTAKVEVIDETHNEVLIKKVFDKHTNEPTIYFNVNFDEWPIDQLKMLTNVFDISIDEISQYIIKHYLNEKTLIDTFADYLKSELK